MAGEPRLVLDASALLALLFREPGTETVREALRGALMSAVNLAEVLQVARRKGGNVDGLREELELRGLTFVQFSPEDAESSAALYPLTRDRSLSLADRACLALALRLGLPALTGDRAWTQVDTGVDVRLFRHDDDA